MASSAGLTELIRNHTYVGLADSVLSLLQHGTRLYLAQTDCITREMFYQQVRHWPTTEDHHLALYPANSDRCFFCPQDV